LGRPAEARRSVLPGAGERDDRFISGHESFDCAVTMDLAHLYDHGALIERQVSED
jgi:hypothetical protein